MIRIDAHQHFWELSRGDYGWLNARDFPGLYRDFLPEHLAPLLDRSGIARTVVVQAAPTDAETRFLLDLAQQTPFIAGVVGWTDFESPDAARTIEMLAADRDLLGLRPMLQDLSDDAWLLRPAIAPAVTAMVDTKLRFDALVKPRHLPVLLRFLEQRPDLAVVIDHAAKPSIAAGTIDAWEADMRRIARNTNAFCKVSGLITEAGQRWTIETLEPYVAVLIDAFGARRLMWGSDWPVLQEAYVAREPGADPAYVAWLDAAEKLFCGLSADDRAWIFGGTAAAFYRIDSAQSPRSPQRHGVA